MVTNSLSTCRRPWVGSIGLALAVMIFTAGSAGAAVERAIERVKPALVRISVVWTSYAQGREVKQQASGSGVIISKRGHVITNHHVAGRAARIVCVLSTNEELEAELIGTDPLSDIAVLRLRAAPDREFPMVEFGDSNRIEVGDEVFAMGSPLALSQSVTRGIVSNTKMVMPGSYRRFEEFTMEGEPVGAMVRWLAHDAPIFPGNSGGPLVDRHGRVIGINEISFGLGGAIPSNLARAVAEQLIEHGRVIRSWLGLELQPLLKNEDLARGVLVRGVVPDSPAEAAGIQSGDILLSLDGMETTVRFDEEVPLINQQLAALPIGKEVAAVVRRDGAEQTVRLTTRERQPAEPRAEELTDWGVTARDLSPAAIQELKLGETRGALVTSVRPAGPAGRAKPPLQRGDVITAVNHQPVTNLAELKDISQAVLTNATAPMPVLVRFARLPEELLSVVAIGTKPPETPAREARKAWLPVALQVITRDLAEQLGDPQLTGVRVTQVYAGTTAARDGLQAGDLIVALDGEPLRGREPGDDETFRSQIRQYRIGARPELTVRRGDQTLALAVELERTPLVAREMPRYEDERFEFGARDVCFFDRVDEHWSEDVTGALVTEVKPGGWAALAELSAGDLIQAVDAEPVTDVAALEGRLAATTAARPEFVVFRVRRGIHTHYLQLETPWKPQPTP